MQLAQTRRRFLLNGWLAGASWALCGGVSSAEAEAPPETPTVRLPAYFKLADCQVGEYFAADILRSEGFSDIRWVESGTGGDSSDWMEHDEIDFDWNYPWQHVRSIDAGIPITVLGGLHVGCLEVVARTGINTFLDLKGQRVGVYANRSAPHYFMMVMAAYVGLDPYHDIEWVTDETVSSIQLFIDGKVDAILGSPPEPQTLRRQGLGHTILATAKDRPWSDCYCCMLSVRNAYLESYPSATKHVMRAMLKSIDLCASAPEQVARQSVERGFAADYEFVLEAMRDLPFDAWREYDPEYSLRFYALRMKECGLITTAPNDVIASGTDWSLLEQLKRELKG